MTCLWRCIMYRCINNDNYNAVFLLESLSCTNMMTDELSMYVSIAFFLTPNDKFWFCLLKTSMNKSTFFIMNINSSVLSKYVSVTMPYWERQIINIQQKHQRAKNRAFQHISCNTHVLWWGITDKCKSVRYLWERNEERVRLKNINQSTSILIPWFYPMCCSFKTSLTCHSTCA